MKLQRKIIFSVVLAAVLIIGIGGSSWAADTPGKDRKEINLAKVMKGGNKDCWRISDKAELTADGRTFASGIQRALRYGAVSTAQNNVLYLNVQGRNTLTFTAWTDTDVNIFIFDQNYRPIVEFQLLKNTFEDKEIDITGCSKIAFGANQLPDRPLKPKGKVKFFDPIIFVE